MAPASEGWESGGRMGAGHLGGPNGSELPLRVILSPLTSERQSAFYSSLSPVQSKSLGAQQAFNKFVCATLSRDAGERPLALPIPLTPVASLTEALGNG